MPLTNPHQFNDSKQIYVDQLKFIDYNNIIFEICWMWFLF